jgi:hypothetical protein
MQEKLLDLIKQDVQTLVASGIFDALPPASNEGPTRAGEEPPDAPTET